MASIPAPAGDPLAGLDVIDAGPAPAATDAAARVQPNTEPTTAGQGGTDWLSPEGALKGEFGDLVENIPQRPNAQAPVFPTPPAPWPTIAANPASAQPAEAPGGGAGMLADLDAGFEEVLGTASAHPEAGAPSDQPLAGTGAAGSDMAAADAPQAEVWADSYGAEADAIHGDLEPAAQGGSDPLAGLPTLPPSGDPASYLASEWPEPAAADASSVPTPVVPGPAILPGWDAAGATRTPAAPVPPDPLLDAARHQDDDAFRWGKTPQETPADSIGAIERSTSAVDEWAFGPAEDDPGRPVVTASSLAAAEALERVAVQLRQGTLRADGFAPALGEAAALSAALAALLGIDARWDVQR